MGAVLAYVFGCRKDEVFLQFKALLEPFGLTRFYTGSLGGIHPEAICFWTAYLKYASPLLEHYLWKDEVFLQWQELLKFFAITQVYTDEREGLRAASRGRVASRGEGEHTEHREHTHQSSDPDQAVRTPYDVLVQDGTSARSCDRAMHQSICMRATL